MTNASGPFDQGTKLHLIQLADSYDIVLEHPHQEDQILFNVPFGTDTTRLEWLLTSAAQYHGIGFELHYGDAE